MANGDASITALTQAIRDGTVPESDDVLSADLPSSAVANLLQDISYNRESLDAEIRETSQSLAGNVDEWIERAKKVQGDITRCKEDAKRIVEEHEQVLVKEREVADAAQKTELLQHEIEFTARLQQELQSVLGITQRLHEAAQLAENNNIRASANIVAEVRFATSNVVDGHAKSLLHDQRVNVEQRLRDRLRSQLDNRVSLKVNQESCELDLQEGIDIDSLSDSLDILDPDKELFDTIRRKLEHFAIQALRRRSDTGLESYSTNHSAIEVRRGSNILPASEALRFLEDFVTIIKTNLGATGLLIINQPLVKIVDVLIRDCLNDAVPTEIHQLDQIEKLQKDTSETVRFLRQHQFQGSSQLAKWVEDTPRTWLSKRKAETLDSVRRSFKKCKGITHQVERTERQKASAVQAPNEVGPQSDDWNTSWDDEKTDESNHHEVTEDGDEASGWGFEDEDEHDHPDESGKSKRDMHNGDPHDDAEDAWGWGDDEDNERRGQPTGDRAPKTNGTKGDMTQSQEIVLTELYMVTDIPDHIIEVLGKDISDAILLQQDEKHQANGIKAASGLLSLPTFALAMFRATAQTQYTSFRNLGNMNLYNDSLYIADKLRSISVPNGMVSIEADCKAMEKLARSAYAREMDIQRTILNDLLDGAQGFTSCTQFPYSQEIENAVSSTVDRLRAVHAEWQPILSTSALLQSIGALLSSVIHKVINDIEEMEDISEAQSQRLVALCGQIAALEDLFLAKPPGTSDVEEEPVPMTAVYVSNWLKFQYLMNILDSSLVDLKFLWTEGELSLEFSQDEVVDLIKALFTESSHRRSAIAAIKGQRGSGLR